MPTEIIPGILTHTYEEYVTRLELIESSAASWVHVDVMDGQFVPNISVMPHEFMSIATRLKMEAHMMVHAPERYYSDLSVAGCSRVLIHREVYPDLEACAKALKQAKDYFAEVGLVYNLDTPLEPLASLQLDSVQCMSITPGQSGQVMRTGTKERIEEVAAQRLGIPLAVDGGVSDENITMLKDAGATRFIITSHLFANNSISQNFSYFNQLVTGGA